MNKRIYIVTKNGVLSWAYAERHLADRMVAEATENATRFETGNVFSVITGNRVSRMFSLDWPKAWPAAGFTFLTHDTGGYDLPIGENATGIRVSATPKGWVAVGAATETVLADTLRAIVQGIEDNGPMIDWRHYGQPVNA